MQNIARPAFLLGSFLLIFLGLGHLLSHFSRQASTTPQIFLDMQAYQVEFMGSHSLYKFFEGFSITMGVMFIVLGALLFQIGRTNFHQMPTIFFWIVIAAVASLLILSLTYFHIVAIALSAMSLICFAVFPFRTSHTQRVNANNSGT